MWVIWCHIIMCHSWIPEYWLVCPVHVMSHHSVVSLEYWHVTPGMSHHNVKSVRFWHVYPLTSLPSVSFWQTQLQQEEAWGPGVEGWQCWWDFKVWGAHR
eukprot:jgi/Botrbrau1/9523/Bobra.0211s0014.1